MRVGPSIYRIMTKNHLMHWLLFQKFLQSFEYRYDGYTGCFKKMYTKRCAKTIVIKSIV